MTTGKSSSYISFTPNSLMIAGEHVLYLSYRFRFFLAFFAFGGFWSIGFCRKFPPGPGKF